jgi:hypothetical protein
MSVYFENKFILIIPDIIMLAVQYINFQSWLILPQPPLVAVLVFYENQFSCSGRPLYGILPCVRNRNDKFWVVLYVNSLFYTEKGQLNRWAKNRLE